MKINLFILIFAVLGCKAYAQQTPLVFSVRNDLNAAQSDKVVAVPWGKILARYPAIDTANMRIINTRTGAEVPFQLEKLGGASVLNLLVLVTVPAKSSLNLKIVKGRHKPFQTRTYGRYVPERKDDFAWENDRIAFRMYGKALEGTNENAYGVDVWVKRTPAMVINDRYKRGNYHMDQGDGMDYYHVGFTLGAGGAAPFLADSLWYSANYVDWKMLDNGPLRTTFQLLYNKWNVNGKQVSAIKTVSLDAGSQLSHFRIDYTFDGISSLPVAVGIVKRKEPGIAWLNEQKGILAYWEPEHGKDGITGVGALLSAPSKQMTIRNGQYLAVAETGKGGVFEYYAGACWNKAGLFTTGEQWFNYLRQFEQQVRSPLRVIL